MLHNRGPHGAGEVAAARDDRHRHPPVPCEPQGGVGDDRREHDRAGDANQQAVGEYELPQTCRLAGDDVPEPEHERAGDDRPEDAEAIGLVTTAYDESDWDDEVRLMLEERAFFSPDALTAMEANLRFAGPETMETRIFGRLTAWQNWVFQRPSAAGDDGSLKRYGSGLRPTYDTERV